MLTLKNKTSQILFPVSPRLVAHQNRVTVLDKGSASNYIAAGSSVNWRSPSHKSSFHSFSPSPHALHVPSPQCSSSSLGLRSTRSLLAPVNKVTLMAGTLKTNKKAPQQAASQPLTAAPKKKAPTFGQIKTVERTLQRRLDNLVRFALKKEQESSAPAEVGTKTSQKKKMEAQKKKKGEKKKKEVPGRKSSDAERLSVKYPLIARLHHDLKQVKKLLAPYKNLRTKLLKKGQNFGRTTDAEFVSNYLRLKDGGKRTVSVVPTNYRAVGPVATANKMAGIRSRQDKLPTGMNTGV